MLDVHGTSCQRPRQMWTRPIATGGCRSAWFLPGYVVPALCATILAALILHLLVELASRLTPADPAGVLSVLVGVAAVLVTLLPFTVLCAKRARAAWQRAEGG